MRRLLIAVWALASCAQAVITGDGLDARTQVSPQRDAAENQPLFDDATVSRELDAGPQLDAGPNPDATTIRQMDASVTPPSGCNQRIQDNVFVPEPVGMAAFRGIRAIAFGRARQLYVLSRTGPPYMGWVTEVSAAPAHTLVRTFGHGRIGSAQDLAVDSGGNVLVLDYNRSSSGPPVVHVFDPNGNFIRTWNAEGGGQDEAYSIAVDAGNRVYVGGLVLFRYSNTGQFIDTVGQWGGSNGRIGMAHGLVFDPRGFMWVADLARNKVHKFDVASGMQVTEIGGRGNMPGLFDGTEAPDVRWGPLDVGLDANGDIYANDPFVSRIQKLSPRGFFLGEFSLGGTMNVGPIKVEPVTGNVYVGMDSAVAIVCPL